MMVFADTSALVKLYIPESGSETTRQQFEAASEVVVAVVAYAEARAAFAAHRRSGHFGRGTYTSLIAAFDADWPGLAKLQITEAICVEAGQFAERYALRGYDGIQMACYAQVARSAGEAEVEFICFDQQLGTAVKRWIRGYRRSGHS